MERSPNTISEELRRNKVKGRYRPVKAEAKSRNRERYAHTQRRKMVYYQDLKREVVSRLKDGQMPRAIARRITRHEKHLVSISKDAIYRWLDTSYGAAVKNLLQKRKRHPKRGYHGTLDGRTFIDKRPKIIDGRGRVGDSEFDFIVSGRDGKGIFLTVVDRKLRKCFVEKILPVSIRNFEKAFLRIKKRYPEMRTGTTDNDLLLKRHKRLEKLLGIKIYFCHPYSSWEKGAIEHVNGVIRRDVPKGSDLSKCSRRFIRRIEEKINRRPMECLGDWTPDEMMARHRARKKKKTKKYPRNGVS
jgi:transposase, IS30 family